MICKQLTNNKVTLSKESKTDRHSPIAYSLLKKGWVVGGEGYWDNNNNNPTTLQGSVSCYK